MAEKQAPTDSVPPAYATATFLTGQPGPVVRSVSALVSVLGGECEHGKDAAVLLGRRMQCGNGTSARAAARSWD